MQGNSSIKMIDPSRAQFDGELRSDEMSELAKKPDLEVIQTSAPVSNRVWDALNAEFFPLRPDVELRVYGHYSETCDLRLAGRMSNVRRFAADSLQRAANVECIADMESLESLSLGIFDLENLHVLELVPPTLTTLKIGPTRSKAPDLVPLKRFRSLTTIYLEGHSKNLEVLSQLEALEDVTLRSVTSRDLGYLRPLSRIWSLDLKLGGIKSLRGIEGKDSIKYLELWQIRGFSDVSPISTLGGLQNLFLQSLPHVQAVPPLRDSRGLRRITLMNMKGMADLGELEWAPTLEEFALLEAQGQDPDQLIPVLRNPSLKKIDAGFGSNRKNNRFEALRENHGKEALGPMTEFNYR